MQCLCKGLLLHLDQQQPLAERLHALQAGVLHEIVALSTMLCRSADACSYPIHVSGALSLLGQAMPSGRVCQSVCHTLHLLATCKQITSISADALGSLCT